MNECRSCRWWGEADSDEFHIRNRPAGWDLCTLSQAFSLMDVVTAPKADGSPARMYAQDGSEYWAGLVTAPDFGCNDFEGKANE